MIDSRAVVSGDAKVGARCRIGPFAVVEPGVVLGDDCVIEAHAVLKSGTQIGAGCHIGEHAVLGGAPQDIRFDPATPSRLEIGARTVIREFVTIHRATKPEQPTTVGSHNYLMVGVHLGHDVRMGNHNILANNVLLAGFVTFGDRIVVGGGTVFHQFVRVGSHAMVQGLSKFGQDIPPFALAAEYNGVAGLNLVGMRRAGLDAATRGAVRDLFDAFYARGSSPAAFLQAYGDRSTGAGAVFVDFIRAGSKRGYCRFVRASEFKGKRSPAGSEAAG